MVNDSPGHMEKEPWRSTPPGHVKSGSRRGWICSRSASLADLFKGRSQLLIYHFMFGPDYTAGCPACSAIADGFIGVPRSCATFVAAAKPDARADATARDLILRRGLFPGCVPARPLV
jgi:hypothetical protein